MIFLIPTLQSTVCKMNFKTESTELLINSPLKKSKNSLINSTNIGLKKLITNCSSITQPPIWTSPNSKTSPQTSQLSSRTSKPREKIVSITSWRPSPSWTASLVSLTPLLSTSTNSYSSSNLIVPKPSNTATISSKTTTTPVHKINPITSTFLETNSKKPLLKSKKPSLLSKPPTGQPSTQSP